MCICLLDKDAFTTLTPTVKTGGNDGGRPVVCLRGADQREIGLVPVPVTADGHTCRHLRIRRDLQRRRVFGNIAQIDGGDAVARILMDGLPGEPTHAAVSDPEPTAYTVSVALSPSATARKTSSLDASPTAAA